MRREYRSPGAGRSRFVLKRGFEAGLAWPRTVGRGRQGPKSADDRGYHERGIGRGGVAVACSPGLISTGNAAQFTTFAFTVVLRLLSAWMEPGFSVR